MSLGKRISTLRKQRGLTQQELAGKVGVHANHVTRWERDRMRPSSKTIAMIAEALAVTADELFASSDAQSASMVADPQLLRTFHQAQELSPEDRGIVIRMVEALLTKKRMEQALRLTS